MSSELQIKTARFCISPCCGLKRLQLNSSRRLFFTLNPEMQTLHCKATKKDDDTAKIYMSTVKDVQFVKRTEFFLNHELLVHISEGCAFSIIFGDDLDTLDLVANSRDVANIVVSGLRYLISPSKQCLDLIDGQNARRLVWLKSVFETGDVDNACCLCVDRRTFLSLSLLVLFLALAGDGVIIFGRNVFLT